MPDASPCPQFHELSQLASGELTGTEVDTICDHVLACPECAAKLSRMPDDENLVGSIRSAPAKYSIDSADTKAVELLMSRLRLLPRYTNRSSDVKNKKETDSDGIQDTGIEQLTDDSESQFEYSRLVREFLSPPQLSSEVGFSNIVFTLCSVLITIRNEVAIVL